MKSYLRKACLFGPPEKWPEQDLIALSREFDVDLVLGAYREGVFPMPVHLAEPVHGYHDVMGWWSPEQRGVLRLNELRVTRSLRKSAKKYRVTVDQAFPDVLARCADPARDGFWIDDEITGAYTELHAMGVAHSIEAWTPSGQLAGGLYGISQGGFFAGESMFFDPEVGRDASKVALLRLVEMLDNGDERRFIDVQWVTDHLASLGAGEVPRADYLAMLAPALQAPGPDWEELAARAGGAPAGEEGGVDA